MENVNEILRKVGKEILCKYKWKCGISKGGYLVVDIPYKIREMFEVELMLMDVLEHLSMTLDVHFDYKFYENKIKVFVLN